MNAGRTYCLIVLTAMSALNQLDRQLLSIVLEPVRREFALSDVQLGLLSGLAFAALYTTLSIPAAIWAVNHNRRNLIAAAAAVWGVMTMLCGAAQSFVQLFIARLGVGVGEAGGIPPSHAMISDLYRPGERATAMATWAAGINIGIFLAFMFGGLIAQRWGWRTAFVVAGGVTVLFAIVMRLTVREPRARGRAGPAAAAMRSGGQVRESCLLMWRDPVLRHICIGAIITATVGYGALAWIPSYLVRSHQMSIATIGAYLACAVGIGGALGSWLGGRYSDVLRRRDVRWSLWLVAAAVHRLEAVQHGVLFARRHHGRARSFSSYPPRSARSSWARRSPRCMTACRWRDGRSSRRFFCCSSISSDWGLARC